MSQITFDLLTATIGTVYLKDLLLSVNNLLYNPLYNITHTIVIDGDKYSNNAYDIINSIPPAEHITRNVVLLPFNTGGNGFLCNKIYAGFVHLLNGDYIIFLDEDNTVKSQHIENYYNLISTRSQTDWLFCLRNIMDKDGNFVCKDLCESLGNLHSVFHNPYNHLIDTNCFCVKKNIAIEYSMFWNKKSIGGVFNPDRIYSDLLMTKEKNFECTFDFTLNYRVASRNESSTENFFIKGNEFIINKYGKIPWETKNDIIVVSNQNFDATDKIITGIYNKSVIVKDLPSIGDKILINKFVGYFDNSSPVLVIDS